MCDAYGQDEEHLCVSVPCLARRDSTHGVIRLYSCFILAKREGILLIMRPPRCYNNQVPADAGGEELP